MHYCSYLERPLVKFSTRTSNQQGETQIASFEGQFTCFVQYSFRFFKRYLRIQCIVDGYRNGILMPEFKMLTYIHFKGEMAPRVLANLVSIHPYPCGIMRASNAKIDVLLVEIRKVRVGIYSSKILYFRK